jgi:inorganic pyrophosphatase
MNLQAEAFLQEEYNICFLFILVFAIIIFCLISWGQNSIILGGFTVISFIFGALTSILCGYIGMRVAVYSNVRTTINAQKEGYQHCFNTAFRAGSVMGFTLTSLGVSVLYILLIIYNKYFNHMSSWGIMMDCIAGYGLGGSSIAMFGRVGGGIYTKAADVGADLVGKIVHGIPEDDARNPATIADNVGDNVIDIAGMGADLFGSYAESTCAALVIASHSIDLRDAGWGAICYPLLISSCGIFVSFLVTFNATHFFSLQQVKDFEITLRLQLIITTIIMIPV